MLLAAIGGPKWDTTDPAKPRPEQGLLGIRKALGLYANLRPVRIFDALKDASSLKPEYLEGVDMLIVRELTGGLYFGARARETDVDGAATGGAPGMRAYDTMDYREFEIERIARTAFEAARTRRGRVHSVDKANVLESSRLWREVVHRLHEAEYADIELIDQLVDNSAMQLVRNPAQFDVMVTENMFGDILSDEASMLTGSLGMLASASLGAGTALYEPSHGSAPDIAGQGIANPARDAAVGRAHAALQLLDARRGRCAGRRDRGRACRRLAHARYRRCRHAPAAHRGHERHGRAGGRAAEGVAVPRRHHTRTATSADHPRRSSSPRS